MHGSTNPGGAAESTGRGRGHDEGTSEHATTISLVDSELRPARPAPAALRVVHPRELRGRRGLAGTVTLGRAPDPAAYQLVHPTVSRRHAEVRRDPRGHHVIHDLGSRHGTEVGGTRLTGEGRALADGDVVRLGDVLLVYEVGEVEDHAAIDRDAIPGQAPAIASLRAQLGRAAADPAPALVLGDTGTGKELVARELHRLSGRRGPLVAVNCATLSPHLAESQLFGHVRGAFTGASTDAPGWFRQADGGTLFLDELGELPLELQPKLLRVVQDRRVQPLGGDHAHAVDVRLVCATHRDLAAEVERGRFRRDLYARVARIELRVPSLSARRGDILDWLDRLWSAWGRERGRAGSLPGWRPGAVAALLAHPWPDNLRGLERLVQALAAHDGRDRAIERAQLPPWIADAVAPAPAVAPAESRRPVPSREDFLAAWTAHRGSVRAVARHFGRDRRQIYRWLASFGLRGDGDGDAEGDGGGDD